MISFKLSQLENAVGSIFSMDVGISIFSNELQFENAYFPISFNLGGNFISFNDTQFSKVRASIISIFSHHLQL